MSERSGDQSHGYFDYLSSPRATINELRTNPADDAKTADIRQGGRMKLWGALIGWLSGNAFVYMGAASPESMRDIMLAPSVPAYAAASLLVFSAVASAKVAHAEEDPDGMARALCFARHGNYHIELPPDGIGPTHQDPE